ncbi:MAG: (2Fe-2S) ferredoxin domain-containing protein [Clostridia bacterium]|nr:(2Fe-2S) ferredoxin domain-containing protein [Clostridia bacterium]
MVFIQVCVGSACHLKGSQEIVTLFQNAVEEYHLEDEVVLSGSFCMGKCSQTGVTVQIDEQIHVGVTKEEFKNFFKTYVLDVIEKEGSHRF